MTTSAPPLAAAASSKVDPQRLVVVVMLSLAAMNGLWWLIAAFTGQWILDSHGVGIPTDFVNVYAAGQMALEGRPAAAYDWNLHKHVEEAVLGGAFDGFIAWHYPPPYLLVARELAPWPYPAAFAIWVIVSFAVYAAVIRRLFESPLGWLLAFAWPLTLHNVLIGQNGFLTAALLGGALLTLEKRPWLAGVLIGGLMYKPQFGLLLPLALAAGGYWRSFAAAALTAMVLVAVSWLAFGTDVWVSFVEWLPRTSSSFLVEGRAEFGRMQSVLSLVRYVGGSDALARGTQGFVSLVVASGVAVIWRRRTPFALKAAALATAVPLATPYLYAYDLVVLVIPVALLLRPAAGASLRPSEAAALAASVVLLVAFPFLVAPVGPFAAAGIGSVVLRRVAAAAGPADAPAAYA